MSENKDKKDIDPNKPEGEITEQHMESFEEFEDKKMVKSVDLDGDVVYKYKKHVDMDDAVVVDKEKIQISKKKAKRYKGWLIGLSCLAGAGVAASIATPLVIISQNKGGTGGETEKEVEITTEESTDCKVSISQKAKAGSTVVLTVEMTNEEKQPSQVQIKLSTGDTQILEPEWKKESNGTKWTTSLTIANKNMSIKVICVDKTVEQISVNYQNSEDGKAVVTTASRKFAVGEAILTCQTTVDPNYILTGWQYKDNDSEWKILSGNVTVQSGHTYVVRPTTRINESAGKVTVIFNAKPKGSANQYTWSSKVEDKGITFANIKPSYNPSGSTLESFVKWVDENGQDIADTTPINSNINVYPLFEVTSSQKTFKFNIVNYTSEEGGEEVVPATIIGSNSSTVIYNNKETEPKVNWSNVEKPSFSYKNAKNGHPFVFEGWYTRSGEEGSYTYTKITDSQEISLKTEGDIEIYAQFTLSNTSPFVKFEVEDSTTEALYGADTILLDNISTTGETKTFGKITKPIAVKEWDETSEKTKYYLDGWYDVTDSTKTKVADNKEITTTTTFKPIFKEKPSFKIQTVKSGTTYDETTLDHVSPTAKFGNFTMPTVTGLGSNERVVGWEYTKKSTNETVKLTSDTSIIDIMNDIDDDIISPIITDSYITITFNNSTYIDEDDTAQTVTGKTIFGTGTYTKTLYKPVEGEEAIDYRIVTEFGFNLGDDFKDDYDKIAWWIKKEDGTYEKCEDLNVTKDSSNIDLYVKLQSKIKISGLKSGDVEKHSKGVSLSQLVLPDNPTEEGKIFTGWQYTQDGGTTYSDCLPSTTFNKDTTITPKFVDDIVTKQLKFDWSDAQKADSFTYTKSGITSTTVGTYSCKSSETKTTFGNFSKPTVSIQGHKFIGWALSTAPTTAITSDKEITWEILKNPTVTIVPIFEKIEGYNKITIQENTADYTILSSELYNPNKKDGVIIGGFVSKDKKWADVKDGYASLIKKVGNSVKTWKYSIDNGTNWTELNDNIQFEKDMLIKPNEFEDKVFSVTNADASASDIPSITLPGSATEIPNYKNFQTPEEYFNQFPSQTSTKDKIFQGWEISVDDGSSYFGKDDSKWTQEITGGTIKIKRIYANQSVFATGDRPYFFNGTDWCQITDWTGNKIKCVTESGTTAEFDKTTFNQEISFGSTTTNIPEDFLKDCTNFTNNNQDLAIPASITKIDDNFMYGCTSFKNKITFASSSNLTSIGDGFMKQCSSYNSAMDLGNCTKLQSIGKDFMFECNSFGVDSWTQPTEGEAVQDVEELKNGMLNLPAQAVAMDITDTFLSTDSQYSKMGQNGIVVLHNKKYFWEAPGESASEEVKQIYEIWSTTIKSLPNISDSWYRTIKNRIN